MAPGHSDFPFPKDLMLKVVQQNNGGSPCKPMSGRHFKSGTAYASCSDKHMVDRWVQSVYMTFCSFAGYFPVVLEALPEGTCVHAHCPVFQVMLSVKKAVEQCSSVSDSTTLACIGSCNRVVLVWCAPATSTCLSTCRSQRKMSMHRYAHFWRQS